MLPSLLDPVLWSLTAGEVAGVAFGDAGALQRLQDRRLKSLVSGAQRDSPWFRRLLKGMDPARATLRDLPVTRKHELMRHFDDWVTDARVTRQGLQQFVADSRRIAQPYLGRYMVWQSSGSTGEPGLFVQDSHAMAVYDALEALRRPWTLRRWLDPCYLGERLVFVGATGGHFASIVATRRLQRLNPALALNLKDVSFLRPLAELVRELNALAPTLLSTYPSAALLLAEECAAGRLALPLKEVWTGGETLTPAMRDFVQGVFGCPVIDSYGASEFLPLAFQCARGRLHLNADWVILESVDARGHAVAAGELGATTLLTNLANRVQPLIRYELGDRVALGGQDCGCGSPLPTLEVQGRQDDMLSLGRGPQPLRLLPLALCTVLEDDAGLFNFQLRQTGPNSLQLSTTAEDAAARAQLTRAGAVLGDYLRGQGARGVHIDCRAGQAPQRGRSGKAPRVIGLGSASPGERR